MISKALGGGGSRFDLGPAQPWLVKWLDLRNLVNQRSSVAAPNLLNLNPDQIKNKKQEK